VVETGGCEALGIREKVRKGKPPARAARSCELLQVNTVRSLRATVNDDAAAGKDIIILGKYRQQCSNNRQKVSRHFHPRPHPTSN
jgi:hypothetical protein